MDNEAGRHPERLSQVSRSLAPPLPKTTKNAVQQQTTNMQ